MAHDKDKLEAQLRELHGNLTSFSTHDDILELIKIIHQPGFTTPAEALLVSGVVSSLNSHMKVAAELKQLLLNGSRQIIAN